MKSHDKEKGAKGSQDSREEEQTVNSLGLIHHTVPAMDKEKGIWCHPTYQSPQTG